MNGVKHKIHLVPHATHEHHLRHPGELHACRRENAHLKDVITRQAEDLEALRSELQRIRTQRAIKLLRKDHN